MKEVSCRVFEIFFRPLAAKKIPADILVEGTHLSMATLRDKNQRIDWPDFVRVMKNLRTAFTDDELVEIGRRLLRSPTTRFAAVIARQLFSPMEFYDWTFKPKNGLGNQWFTCVEPSLRHSSSTEVELTLTLPPGFEGCWEFFLVTKGNFIEMPMLLGYAPAQVDLEQISNGARYRVVVPQGTSPLARARRVLLWPFAARMAARELKEAHEALQARFEDLEGVRAKLDRQARQLRTAHAISELIHGELDIERTIGAIAHALVTEAGFAFSEVRVDVDVDGIRVQRRVGFGTSGPGRTVERPLTGRSGRRMGVIRVVAPSDASDDDRTELLAFIEPTISMALDNAISYLIVEEYRRGLEKRVEERTLELTQARDELAATVKSLEEAREIRERIFANVNHELRTPLTLILLAVADARAQVSEATSAHGQALSTIESSARRLLRMVDDLLLLAEGRERDLQLAIAPCDLAVSLRRISDAWKTAARKAHITLDVDTPESCPIRADREAVDRVVTNLVSNAFKFTPRGGAVRIVLANEEDGGARIEVRDTGPGIDAELRERLFGRFERGERAVKAKIKGSGLGLSIVKELVMAHGGTIDVENDPTGGAIFRVHLPPGTDERAPVAQSSSRSLAPEDFGIETETRAEIMIYEAERPIVGAATLLVAEDDPDLRDRIARLLASDYRVVVAPDGAIALDLAAQFRPDLLITDLSMPNMDGIELTKRFRALAGNRVAPVLLLTAAGAIGDRLSGFEAGAVDYILKPFDPAELRARVRSQLALRALALQLLESEKLAALGTLSAGLAHEMRNPANGIVNAVGPLRELLPADALPEGSPAAELLQVIEDCSRQIASLSRQLLGFRRGAALDKQNIPIDTLLRRVRATVRPALDGIEVREHLAYRGPVRCAEPLITQVLTNLLDNAAQAAGRGGWIEVRSHEGEGRVIVEFEDSGPGVPADLRERIFEPFFTTKPPGQGTGLGLSTAREIVARHGGSLAVHATAGRTVFRVELPQTD